MVANYTFDLPESLGILVLVTRYQCLVEGIYRISGTNILRSCGMYEIFQEFICLKIYISGKNI